MEMKLRMWYDLNVKSGFTADKGVVLWLEQN